MASIQLAFEPVEDARVKYDLANVRLRTEPPKAMSCSVLCPRRFCLLVHKARVRRAKCEVGPYTGEDLYPPTFEEIIWEVEASPNRRMYCCGGPHGPQVA